MTPTFAVGALFLLFSAFLTAGAVVSFSTLTFLFSSMPLASSVSLLSVLLPRSVSS